MLLDDSDCIERGAGPSDGNCNDAGSLENYYSIQRVPNNGDEDGQSGEGKWRKIRVDLFQGDDGKGDDANTTPPFLLGGYSRVGNGRLDLDRIRGWRIELSAAHDDGGDSDPQEVRRRRMRQKLMKRVVPRRHPPFAASS